MASERGVEIDSLSKGAVAELIEDADGEVLEALKLRLLMAKTSVKKYEAIERSVCSDGRVHGLLQFLWGKSYRPVGRKTGAGTEPSSESYQRLGTST